MMWKVKKVPYPKEAKLLRISPYYKKIFVVKDDMEIDQEVQILIREKKRL